MVNFTRHGLSKTIVLKNQDGVDESYTFSSIGASNLPKIFKLVKKFSKINDKSQSEDIIELLDETTISELNSLIKIMVQKSYPTVNDLDADNFTGNHFFELFPLIFELNIPKR